MDDFLPNDNSTEYFLPVEPAERQRKRDTAKAKSKANEDLIIELLQRIDKRITFYDTLSAIPEDILSDPQLLGFHMAANKQTQANLIQEKEYLKSILKAS